MNRVVVRFEDGRIVKGFTNDFLPAKSSFHVSAAAAGGPVAKPEEIRVAELKALFFVKSLEGDPQHHRSNEPPPGAAGGRRIRVVFKDGEVLVGTTQGYDTSRPGFFVIPFDVSGNNERCFVLAAAAQEVKFV
jgi:uncharacterized protein DUF6982